MTEHNLGGGPRLAILGAYLEAKRAAAGLSMPEVERRVGLEHYALCEIESGAQCPDESVLARLCDTVAANHEYCLALRCSGRAEHGRRTFRHAAPRRHASLLKEQEAARQYQIGRRALVAEVQPDGTLVAEKEYQQVVPLHDRVVSRLYWREGLANPGTEESSPTRFAVDVPFGLACRYETRVENGARAFEIEFPAGWRRKDGLISYRTATENPQAFDFENPDLHCIHTRVTQPIETLSILVRLPHEACPSLWLPYAWEGPVPFSPDINNIIERDVSLSWELGYRGEWCELNVRAPLLDVTFGIVWVPRLGD